MNAAREIRRIADAIDSPCYCREACELRDIARRLESQAESLRDETRTADTLLALPVSERGLALGRIVGAMHTAANRIAEPREVLA